MARVKLSALITSIAGRYGGSVFRNWRGTTVLSVLPSSVSNPATEKQTIARNILAVASKAWSALDSEARAEWRAVAAALTTQWQNSGDTIGARQLIYPPRGPYTGLGAVTSVCGLLGSVRVWDTEDALPDAPVGVGNPSIPVLGALSGDTTAGLTVTWADPDTWGDHATAGNIRIFVKAEDGTNHTQLIGSTAAATETDTFTTITPRGGGEAIAFREGVFFVQIDAVNAEGLRSAPSQVAEVVLAAAV